MSAKRYPDEFKIEAVKQVSHCTTALARFNASRETPEFHHGF